MTEQTKGQIVAMGGGGFSVGGVDSQLDDYVLSLVSRSPARVCFLPTAASDSAIYIARFYRAFSGRCIPSDLTLVDPPGLPRRPSSSKELPDFVAQHDVFYVGGGNTANLLALWRTHGLDKLLAAAWKRGAILCGVSAGMICWFEASLTDSFGEVAELNDGLGLLPGSACPHYDGESTRRPAYHRALQNGLKAGVAADDGAALHFVGTELHSAISSRPGARAYRVRCEAGKVVEDPIPTTFLGG